jgi:uroporphyrin-III C-methyltransferase / precorrin-2 dehydrogenase / sirohydrochlorin ferrochelatase
MDGLPIAFQLKSRSVLVVGGGELALRKIRLLGKTSARIIVIAPSPEHQLARYVGEHSAQPDGENSILLHKRPFKKSDLRGQALVISATGDTALDTVVSDAARARNLPVNVPDQPELCTFHMPSIIDRDPIVVAVSSGGAAPLLVRRVRENIEEILPKRLGKLAEFAARFRDAAKAIVPAGLPRLRFWENALSGPIAEAVLAGREAPAREAMLRLLNGPTPQQNCAPDRIEGGIVHIVGAGPGDPDLLTLKALRLLQRADIVVYDRLIGAEILDFARRDAERVFAGKEKGLHHKTQAEINVLLVEEAGKGKRVVRLKGGDPFVFGRGGEELDYLRQRGIPVEIVPGITAATGCAASAGIPLTHRDFSSAVTFITGHGANDPKGASDIDWAGLAASEHTLVIYMGLSRASDITAQLLANGMPPRTPIAIIENGTLDNERTFIDALDQLPFLAARHHITGPSLIVIGDVVATADAKSLAAFNQALAV